MYDVKKELEDFTQNTVFKSPDIKSQMCKDVATALRFFSENPITRGRILIEGPSWNGMYYVEKEHLDYNGEDRLYYRSFEGVDVNHFGITSVVKFVCCYSYTTHKFLKIIPKTLRTADINLTDYHSDYVIRAMIDNVLKTEFPEHSQKLFYEICRQSDFYKISVNTILNKDNKTIEDVITQRGKYPLPSLKKMTLLSGMVARNAAKTLSGEEYSEFLNFLSEYPNYSYLHPSYYGLNSITEFAIESFRDQISQEEKIDKEVISLKAGIEQSA